MSLWSTSEIFHFRVPNGTRNVNIIHEGLKNSFKNWFSQREFFFIAISLSLFQRFHISTMLIQDYSMLADSNIEKNILGSQFMGALEEKQLLNSFKFENCNITISFKK